MDTTDPGLNPGIAAAADNAPPTVSNANAEQLAFIELDRQINRLIIGQERLMERLMIALLSNGHLLVEGAPGLAKTTAIKVTGRPHRR